MDELLYLRTQNSTLRLCVPDDYQLRTKIIASFHDSAIAAHPGIRRTFLRIVQWYYWKSMERDIHDYVSSCETCARWKHSNAKKNGKLIPIPIPEECWEVVSMDFITGLPESNGFDAIFTAVNKLSKRAKYAAVKTTHDAEKIAHAFFDNVVRHHGIPAVIISDRDPKFTSHFWRSLAKMMGIKLNMTTSHRAQADGQTERQNLILEDALRCMTSHHGRDWSEKLATIEYAHATLTSASTGLSPFEIDTGRKERHPVGLSAASDTNKRKEATDIAEIAKNFHGDREKIIDKAKRQLKQAQESQKRYYDQKRSNVTFKTGDLVTLDTRRLLLQHAAQDMEVKRAKLAARKIGPFPIEKMINDNVARLKLPSRMRRMNPSFNVDILSHYVPNHDRFKTRPLPKASRVYIDEGTGDEMCIVEKLLRQRRVNRKTQWLIKWHGFPEHEATWENEGNVKNVSHWNVLVGEYQQLQREVNRGRM
ncbi:putative retroelement, partial [Globisporangium splendens]